MNQTTYIQHLEALLISIVENNQIKKENNSPATLEALEAICVKNSVKFPQED